MEETQKMNILKEWVGKIRSFFAIASRARTTGLLVFAVMAISLPAFVIIGLHATNYTQHASANPWQDVLDNLHKASGYISTIQSNLAPTNSNGVPNIVPTTFNTFVKTVNDCNDTTSITHQASCSSIPTAKSGLITDIETYIKTPFQSAWYALTSAAAATANVSSHADGTKVKNEILQYRDNSSYSTFSTQFGTLLVRLNQATIPTGPILLSMYQTGVADAQTPGADLNTIINDVTKLAGSPPPQTPPLSCPHSQDAKTYSSSNGCFSSTGLGFNTQGGNYTCGPVSCPGQNTPGLGHGNTCIYSENKNGQTVCFAGYTDTIDHGGFNPPGCHYNPADNDQPITCPVSIPFKIHVNGTQPNNPISIHVDDNTHGNVYLTNATGDITIQTWSGDRIMLTPIASKGYSAITPNTITLTANTSFSCGINSPCTFTATPTSPNTGGTQDATPTPVATSTPGPYPSSTVTQPTSAPTPTPECTTTCLTLPSNCHYLSNNSQTYTPQLPACSCGEYVCH